MHDTTRRHRHHAPRALALSAAMHGLLAAVWLFAPAPARDVNAGAMTVEVLAELPKPPDPASAPPPAPQPAKPQPAAKPRAPAPEAKAKLPRMAAPKPSAAAPVAHPTAGTVTTAAATDSDAQPVTSTNTQAAAADPAAESAPAPAARGVERDDYRRMVWTRIMRFRPPQVPFPGTTRLRFALDEKGELVELIVADSSGSGLLDRAALDAVRRAAPFPPPPGLGAADLRFEIPFHFR